MNNALTQIQAGTTPRCVRENRGDALRPQDLTLQPGAAAGDRKRS